MIVKILFIVFSFVPFSIEDEIEQKSERDGRKSYPVNLAYVLAGEW
jgi:hypothetical protein